MKRIIKMRRIFEEVDAFLGEMEFNARTAGRKVFWRDRRAINEQAYFVIIFAQLEDYINTQCRRLVASKRSQTSWKRKRLWDKISVPRIDRVPFMDRVALLTKRGDADYNIVKALYDARCALAHGGTYSVNVMFQAEDMHNVAKRLKG
jgi:hypothetical protein